MVQLRRRSYNIPWKLGLSEPIFLKVLVTFSWIWSTCHGLHICFQTTAPFTCYMCSYEELTIWSFDTVCHLPMIYIAQTVLQNECCIIFCTHSLTKNHNVESLCTDLFSLCTFTIYAQMQCRSSSTKSWECLMGKGIQYFPVTSLGDVIF